MPYIGPRVDEKRRRLKVGDKVMIPQKCGDPLPATIVEVKSKWDARAVIDGRVGATLIFDDTPDMDNFVDPSWHCPQLWIKK